MGAGGKCSSSQLLPPGLIRPGAIRTICWALLSSCHPRLSVQPERTWAGLPRQAQRAPCGPHRGRAFRSAVRASLCPSPHPVSPARAVGSRPRPCQHGAPAGRDDEPGSVTNLAEADHAPWGPSSPPLSKASEPGAQPPARWPQVGLDPSIQSQAGRDHEAIKSSYLTAASMEYSWARDPTSLCPCRMGC